MGKKSILDLQVKDDPAHAYLSLTGGVGKRMGSEEVEMVTVETTFNKSLKRGAKEGDCSRGDDEAKAGVFYS